MYKITGTTIEMTRGDTLRVEVVMKQPDDTEYTPAAGDVVRFAMKRWYTDAEALITKTLDNETRILELLPEDTKSLPFGKYVYDIEITYADGVVDTFIAKAALVLSEEVL